MKPPAFEYRRPTTLNDALEMLSRYGDNAKVLAGGQSLVPMMNFRLASPRMLIDINRIAEIAGIAATLDGLALKALARWRELETSDVVSLHNPLLQQAVRHIAHYQIRNQGTVGGSSAHADPAAEFPAVALACNASFNTRSIRGARILSARDFFRGPLETALLADELLTEIQFPPWPQRRRWGFEEFSRRAGDFALAGAVAILDLDDDNTCCSVSLVSFGLGERPMRLARAEAHLNRHRPFRTLLAQAARIAAEDCEAKSDMHAPADYRQALFETLMFRALCSAAGTAKQKAA